MVLRQWGEYNKIILVYQTELIKYIGHRRVSKLMFQALALCEGEWRDCALSACLYAQKWSYAIGGNVATRKQE